LCFPPLPILFSSIPNRSAAYPRGYEYHRLGTTVLEYDDRQIFAEVLQLSYSRQRQHFTSTSGCMSTTLHSATIQKTALDPARSCIVAVLGWYCSRRMCSVYIQWQHKNAVKKCSDGPRENTLTRFASLFFYLRNAPLGQYQQDSTETANILQIPLPFQSFKVNVDYVTKQLWSPVDIIIITALLTTTPLLLTDSFKKQQNAVQFTA
jgi:hypothetical protein